MEMTQSHQTLDSYYDSFGGGWGWGRRFGGWGDGFGESATTQDTYRVGTLVVDLFDSSTKNLIWRGLLSDVMSDESNKNIKNLDKGVVKLFDHFSAKHKERMSRSACGAAHISSANCKDCSLNSQGRSRI